MKYLCLIYFDEKDLGAMPGSEVEAAVRECLAYEDELRENGHLIAAEVLESVHAATTVRIRNGKMSMTDGPFAETKEQLGGFFLVAARDLNAAVQVAARLPQARFGSIEVRPIRELSQR